MSETKLEAYFFTVVFVVVLVVVGMLFFPFVGSLALALVLATLLTPLDLYLHKYVKNDGLVAALIVLFVSIAILAPLLGLFFLLINEVRGIAEYASSLDLTGMPVFIEQFELKLHSIFPLFPGFDVPAILQSIAQNLAAFFRAAVTGTADLLLKLFVSVIALYYFMKDRRKFLNNFIALSPLSDDEDTQIVRKLKDVTHSLIRGSLVIAFLQGVLTGGGFLVFGVPNPVLWGSVAAVAALIPTVGTAIVAFPAVLYLFVIGNVPEAIGLALWSSLFVGLVDNVLRPKLIGSSSKIHPLFILLAVLGGLLIFGVAGFLLGPLIFGLLVALSEIYKVKVREIHRMSSLG